jgi:transposase
MEQLETIVTRACGLDVHKDTVKACIMRQGIKKQIRTFDTMTDDLIELKNWLHEHEITHVAIESTGVYWKPVFNILGDDFELVLVNARHVKNVPGKKTDVLDCEWLCRLLRAGLLKGSFIPKEDIRQLRDLTRYQKKLSYAINTEKNRVQKVLQDANIKLSSVLSDVFGKAGWIILKHLSEGITDVDLLIEPFYHIRKLYPKIEQAKRALKGKLTLHHQVLLKILLEHILFIEKQVAKIERQVQQILKKYQDDYKNLQTIFGVKDTAAASIIAEIGTNMDIFPDENHLASWTGLCPGNNESAGKKKSSRTTHGNKYLKSLMVECAWTAMKTKNSYLRAKYYSLVPRLGKKKAIVAIARKLLVYCYYVLKNKAAYKDLGEAYIMTDNQKERKIRYLLKRLNNFGFDIEVKPKAEPVLS